MNKELTIIERLQPLRFRGKAYQIVTPTFPPSQPAPTNPEPIAKLNHHLDSCYVKSVVRITETGGLSTENLGIPDFEPWFLLRGEYRNLPRYFIVNGEECYLPVLSGRMDEPDELDCYSIMNPAAYKEELVSKHKPPWGGTDETYVYEWDMFSLLDLGLVREAIATYTGGVY